MTPADFILTWAKGGSRDGENERQGAQAFFLELCELLDVPKPGMRADIGFGAGASAQDAYIFEQRTEIVGQRTGFADVYWRGRFAWENKAPGGNFDEALKQLLGYTLALDNPPLLIVCDRRTIRIHTQFTGHPSTKLDISIADLQDAALRNTLRRIWLDPESFRPKETSRDITEKAAKSFATLADGLRKRGPQQSPEKEAYAEQIAHFLTQTLFCFFAEDVGLLPNRMFEYILNNRRFTSQQLTETLQGLLEKMRDGGIFGANEIPWFNGGLFKRAQVPKLEITDITELRNAARLNWSAIDVSIFGTLFERGLDPAKRSQLGAHYTDPATIERIIEPVIRRPLLLNWERSAQEIRRLQAKNTNNSTKKSRAEAKVVYARFLQSLADFKILDPACGSGNFLFLGLKALKDIELKVITEAQSLGLDRPVDLVTGPANMHGIELSEYAAELARVTVWIGELQWRMARGYPFKENPILEPLEIIEHRDALMVKTRISSTSPTTVLPEPHSVRPEPVEGQAPQYAYSEAEWPKVSVVIGNPPFLGDKKMRGELGDEYVTALRKTYEGRVPGGADLVCYWFEQARRAIETRGLGAAGLVSTNSIRGGKNRFVLDAICKTTRIYTAWSDEEWVNDGAAVRVSLVALGWGECCFLNGEVVERINADLTGGTSEQGVTNLTAVNKQATNSNACFVGTSKKASFDVSGEIARNWLTMPNPHGKSNADVVKPWINGSDLVRLPSDTWIVDFGVHCNEPDAMLYELPFTHIFRIVKPEKEHTRNEAERRKWWLHARAAPDMRKAIGATTRYAATSIVAKHRLWVWRSSVVLPSHAVCITARADDTTFGILHSRFHELWSLRMCTWLGVGNDPRYTPTTCFETFPFPAGLTPLDTAHQRIEGIEGGALIPAGLSAAPSQPSSAEGKNFKEKRPVAGIEYAQSAMNSGVNRVSLREAASAVARAAHRLHSLRESWLNPPEWTQRLPEITPLGMDASPYPDRILPRNNLSEQDRSALFQRTLTNLYNQKAAGQVQWLQSAHEQLDQAVAAAYGWADYSPALPDEEILKRLLALNLARSGG